MVLTHESAHDATVVTVAVIVVAMALESTMQVWPLAVTTTVKLTIADVPALAAAFEIPAFAVVVAVPVYVGT